MKATLEFNLPDDQEELDVAMKAGAMRAALSDISNEVFRPARKHGYDDSELQALIESCPVAVEVIAALEQRYAQILEEYGVQD
jgi:hypothetical protein